MVKQILQGKEAMAKIKEGIDLVANPVKSTIGPLGRTVLISESFVAEYNVHNLPVTITKDGWRVSKSISSSDPMVQVGVKLIQEAAEKTMNDCGDATSTTCLLTQSLLDGGLKLIEEGASHVEVVNGINKAVDYVVSELKKMAVPIGGDIEKIRQVATVTSNNDEVIGGLIAEAFSKIGADGIINIEEAKGRETSIKIADGVKFGRGWASQYFVTNKAKSECVLDNPFILIYDRPITILKDLMPILEKILMHQKQTGEKRPLMIFCDATDGEALATLTYNMQQGGLQSCVVEMAFLGQHKRDFMEDIAAATGGYFINELKGKKLENVELQDLGQAKKVVVGKEETVIIEGIKDEAIFNNLVSSIKELEAKEEDAELKELLKKRAARLNGSVAILSVGATTELEMKEKKDRVDDAVRATRSAIEEGVTCGAGTAFLNINYSIDVLDKTKKGQILVFSCLTKSLEQICINSVVEYKKIQDNILSSTNKNYGYNAKTDILEDLLEAGIIEPVKSNRCALQNAASVVCQILSSKFLIADTL